MKSFEEQYFMILPDLSKPGLIQLEPDDLTAKRAYMVEELKPGKPLVFFNANAEEFMEEGINEQLTDVIFDIYAFAVRDEIREKLVQFDIPGLQFYPMVYRDMHNNLHTDYWYANFFKQHKFLDEKESDIIIRADPDDEDDEHYVDKFVFNRDAMRLVPEEERLIFLLARVTNDGIFVHERIMPLLGDPAKAGFCTFRVSEFVEGVQDG